MEGHQFANGQYTGIHEAKSGPKTKQLLMNLERSGLGFLWGSGNHFDRRIIQHLSTPYILSYQFSLIDSNIGFKNISYVHKYSGHSCPPSSLVSPKKGAGARVGVGMLRGGGDSLAWFQCFLVSCVVVLLVSWFLRFENQKCNNHMMFLGRCWSHIPKFHFMFSRIY